MENNNKTDKEKLIELLDYFGVGYINNVDNNEVFIESNNNNVVGYCGFYTEFNFNEDGSFVNIGIWE